MNKPEIASYALQNGVDRIFLDLEKLGKQERQGHLNTWISPHNINDLEKIRKVVPKGKLLVRLNPWNKKSSKEIQEAIDRDADWLMLPMIRSFEDLKLFCSEVSGRVPVIPLIETPESLELLPKLIKINGVKEIYIGLNDLSISYGHKFMFEPLLSNLIENAAEVLNFENIPWGFGGIARFNEGLLPSENILGEHVRLKSKRLILSRTFHRNINNIEELKSHMNFKFEIDKLREQEEFWENSTIEDLDKNKEKIKKLITAITK